ncbi:putative transcriptional regulator [Actinacidiphila reveromycinica]|uniref:Putative transcriptional regulator n=1 Tax=Actinacidiphila reveromycinica TaxID=659352 RepID=A0A7U3UMH8_9ACTN|nr:TetR/AcrR family transcriptional regulator [Streptomyces sp. SN-593]BBA95287.1 putative transcriptional regulator [Streptomyces sp. SN-593]
MAADTTGGTVRRRDRPSKGALREERILDATRRLVTERSMADITIDDIAAAAGISRTSFYFYFPTKQAVLAALMEQVWERFGQTHGWFASSGPTRADLLDQLRRVAEMWQENSKVLACAMPGGFAVGYRPLEEFVGRAKQRFVDGLAEKIRRDRAAGLAPEGVDAAVLARMVAVVRDHRISEITDLPEEQREGALDELATVVLRMIY